MTKYITISTGEPAPTHARPANKKKRKVPAEGEGIETLALTGLDGHVVRTESLSSDSKRPAPSNNGSATTDFVIETFNAKDIKAGILSNWQKYVDHPEKIVKVMRKLYPNVGTTSSQLSSLKSTLSNLTPRPPDTFLDALKLSKKEYTSLRNAYREKRDKEGFNVTVVHDADKLVAQALEMIVSSDFRVLWPAVVLLSGLRPADVLTVKINVSPQTNHMHPEFWVCISGWAKKGQVHDASKRDFCRDHPLLCPSWLWVRAVEIVRAHFNKGKLTKRQQHQRYGKYQMQLLAKGFPQMVRPTHVLFRRFYAKYSYLYFADDFPNVISENSYTSWVLGHTSMEPALSYTNLQVRGAGKIKLFDIGRNLKVVAPAATTTPAREQSRNPVLAPRLNTSTSRRPEPRQKTRPPVQIKSEHHFR